MRKPFLADLYPGSVIAQILDEMDWTKNQLLTLSESLAQADPETQVLYLSALPTDTKAH